MDGGAQGSAGQGRPADDLRLTRRENTRGVTRLLPAKTGRRHPKAGKNENPRYTGSTGRMAEAASKVVFDDPHLKTGPAEAETIRVRTLAGWWRLGLIALTFVTIFLCINQQFGLRFFIGFTPLNTEYFYL